jgi:drug/metabolite transporter (DMT)-like permease
MEQSKAQGWVYSLGPAILASACFATADILGKIVLVGSTDVLTLSTFRSLFSVAFVFVWLRFGMAPRPHTPRQRWMALGIGVLFAGITYGLFKAIELATVPVAILSYFIYPLLTGIAASALGMERLGWQGIAAAGAAFAGLALIVGAQPDGVALAGVAFACGAAVCRVATLLMARAALHDADTRLTTWYAALATAAIFVAISLGMWHWQGPQSAGEWAALTGLSLATIISIIMLFVSIKRIGPFRSALIMNLEPLLATVGSAVFLGEIVSPLQAVGGAIMLGALVAFQLRR